MAELRSVDPNTLVPNPDNPRRTQVPLAMDDQLVASIKAVGIVQPPRVKEADGRLVIIVGNRRAKAAITAGLAEIDVLVCDADEAADAMRSMSENLIRASMTSVDIWRATEALEGQGWNEQAIADALALPARTIRRLKLLANLHPAMLDYMAGGSMPNEDQLRTIASASRDEQAQVWKKHKPKKGHDVYWHEVARGLAKRRMPFSAAKFDEDLAKAYGVVWEDDLFAPAGEDGRYTTNVEGFFGAQQEWLQNSLPERGILLTTDEYGRHELPKKAEHVYGKPGKHDHIGHYLDPNSGEVRTVAYRMPEPKKPVKNGNAGKPGAPTDGSGESDVPARTRPDVTQKGAAMIGDLRTDALRQALKDAAIDDHTLLALLILAFGGKNVSVQSGSGMDAFERNKICKTIAEGGVLTMDHDVLRRAARDMLTGVLSCRNNMTDSGIVARIAGDAIGASLYLPNMATEEFLSCLSKAGIEKAASAEGVRIEPRGKDTRARLIERFKDSVYVYPAAVFKLTEDDLTKAKASEPRRYVPGVGWNSPDDDDVEEAEAEGGQPEDGGDEAGTETRNANDPGHVYSAAAD